MKLKHVILTIMAFALVVAMAPSAHALCTPPKTFLSWSAAGYTYVYGLNPTAPTFGSFWQPGSQTTSNEGTYDVANWLRYYNASYSYFSGNLGDGGVQGCPTGELIVAVTQDNEDGTASFLITRETENLLAFRPPNCTFAPMPRPRVTGSSRIDATVVVDVAFDGVGNGFFSRTGHVAEDTVMEWVLYMSHGIADAGRNTAGWDEIARAPYNAAGATLTGLVVDCANDGGDSFLAIGLGLGDVILTVPTTELVTLHVGAATAIECDPGLADVDDKFDLIRERGQGEKKGKPFRDN